MEFSTRISRIQAYAFRTTILLWAIVTCAISTQAATYNYVDQPAGGIPFDSGSHSCAATPLTRTISVSDSYIINDLNVGFIADHTWRGDVEVTLRNPANTTAVTFIAGVGGGSDHINAEISDGEASLADGLNHDTTIAPYQYPRGSSNALSAFNGQSSVGNWTIEICDNAGGDAGTYFRSELIIEDLPAGGTGFSGTTTTPAFGSVINTYAKVNSISGTSLGVDTAAGISAGDRGLLIQMKGATVDRSDTSTHGDISAYGSAGRFEYVDVASVSGSTIVLENAPTVSFQTSGLVQFVRVPVYDSQTLTGFITAAPWDGNKGGVIAIDDVGTLTLAGDIDASGHGFRGGDLATQGAYDTCASDQTNYTGSVSIGTGNKGEGITLGNNSHFARRGHNANGGGGGNWTDAGGGGGANYGFGGLGGREIDLCDNTGNFGGLGGEPLDYSPNNRIFLGGGAGSGSEVQQTPQGGNRIGGGIILIRANAINNSSGRLITNGLSAEIDTFNGADGGAAAGVIGVSVRNGVTGTPIAEAVGGDGGSENNTSYAHGTGGGGGGGALVLNGAICSNFNYSLAGGPAGTSVLGDNVGDENWGATDGGPGICIPGFAELPLIPLPGADADYGDAPVSGTSYGEASHEIDVAYYMGANLDIDAANQPSPNADGDDLDGTDDDDGVSIPTLYQGTNDTVLVTVTGAGGYLQAWIDWDNDGSFDAGDMVAADLQDGDGDGLISVPVSVPASASTTQTFARFRWSTVSALDSTTGAADGEVEDYALTIVEVDAASMTCPAGFSVLPQAGNAGTVILDTNNGTTALGALEAVGTSASNANSARNTNTAPILELQLEHLVPAGAPITISLAKNNAAANYNINVSDSGSGYTSLTPYSVGSEDNLQRITFVAPPGGVEYFQFSRVAGSLWIDGISYDHACGQAAITAEKTTAIYDPLNEGLYAIPGNDVIYTIEFTNIGATAADLDSIYIIDSMPSEIEFYNGDIDDGGPESNPVIGVGPGSGLSLDYASDVKISKALTKPADFATCTNDSLVAGYNPDVTFICLNPSGTMAAGDPDPSFQIQFRARIK